MVIEESHFFWEHMFTKGLSLSIAMLQYHCDGMYSVYSVYSTAITGIAYIKTINPSFALLIYV